MNKLSILRGTGGRDPVAVQVHREEELHSTSYKFFHFDPDDFGVHRHHETCKK